MYVSRPEQGMGSLGTGVSDRCELETKGWWVSALKLLSHLSSPNVKSHRMYSLSVKIHYQKTAFPWQAF